MTQHAMLTGSTGFIGKALKDRLIDMDFRVSELNSDLNICDASSFNRFIDADISCVFHCAGKTYVPESWQDPKQFYDTNFTGTCNVLEFCRNKSIPLIHVSSYVYGKPEKLPISEDHPVNPGDPYSHSKHLAELLCNFYARQFGVRIIILRPFDVYGIGQNDKFLIPMLIQQALSGKNIKVQTLVPRRDYVFLDDVISAIILAWSKISEDCHVYNVGSGYSLSIAEIISEIQNVLEIDLPVISEDIIRKNEINDLTADITKAGTELGWQPLHSFREGIEVIVEHEKRRFYGRQKNSDQ